MRFFMKDRENLLYGCRQGKQGFGTGRNAANRKKEVRKRGSNDILLFIRKEKYVFPTRIGFGSRNRTAIVAGCALMGGNIAAFVRRVGSGKVAGFEENHLVAMVMMGQNHIGCQHKGGKAQEKKGDFAVHPGYKVKCI